MTEEQARQLQEIHEWLHKPTRSGGKPRSAQLDDIMFAVSTGRMGFRVFFWGLGAIAAVAAAWAQMKGFLK